uniref:Ig-like domain-containing protein n=1 Tax=Neolamprologus brichardi TaxID=32507 RepID=A0A3Q4M8R1_NEOBR
MNYETLILFLLHLKMLSDTDVKVSPGQDATLYCQSPRGVSVTLLEWSKPELKSEYYVFFFQNQRSYENYQHKFFKGRVELRDPSMKDGIASVILRNVSIIDTGMYMCQITTSNTTNGERVITEPFTITNGEMIKQVQCDVFFRYLCATWQQNSEQPGDGTGKAN